MTLALWISQTDVEGALLNVTMTTSIASLKTGYAVSKRRLSVQSQQHISASGKKQLRE